MSLLQKKQKDEQKSLLIRCCAISAAVAGAVMMIVFLLNRVAPLFGDSSVLRMDLYHQYGPLYAELYDRVVHGQSLIYSWTSGLGSTFIGNLFNYCSSPFAILMLVFGHKNMPDAIAAMMLLKAAGASAAFTYYLNKTTHSARYMSVGFGLLYAFCGYFVAFSWNIMWMDAMVVYPLVILGIEHIINDKKPALYMVAMIYTMFTNYYMAYMVCILSVLHFLFYFFSNYPLTSAFEKKAQKKKQPEEEKFNGLTVIEEKSTTGFSGEGLSAPANADTSAILPDGGAVEQLVEKIEPRVPQEPETPEKKKEKKSIFQNRFLASGFMFAFTSVLCFMVAACALLPVYVCLNASSATGSTFPSSIKTYFNMFDFVANHFAAIEPTIRSSGDIVLPNIYSGIISILLLPAFFMSGKIKGRFKICTALMLGVFYFSFNINYFNFIWHGFHFPNDLPYRFSFAYSFLLLTVGYFALQHISEFSRKYFVAAGVGVIAFIIIVSKVGSKNVDDATQIISILFILLYVILAGLITSNAFTKKRLEFLLIVLIVLELVSADTSKFVMSQSKKNYTSDYTAYQTVSSIAEKDEQDLFYRTELSKLRARMDPSWYGYNGVSVFSSMASEKTSKMMKALGLFSNNINSYTYYPQTPVFNSFFSLKYIYDNADLLSPNDKYTSITTVENFDAYKYNYYLPLAFSVNGDIEDWDPLSNSDPFKVQNDLVRLSTGIDGVFEEVKATDVETSNVNSISLASVNGSTSFSISKVNDSSSGYAKVIIDVEKDGNYYVYAGSTKLSGIKFNAEEDVSYNYISSSIYPFVLDMGERKAGDQISVEYTLDSNSSATVTFCAAMLNQDRFESAYKSIQKNGTMQLDSFKETSFTGHINVTNANATIFTSIPFDKSWSVYVDGVKLQYAREDDTNTDGKIFAIGNGLIGFDAERGEHEIRFEYHPEGLKQGLTISAFGVCICALMILFGVRRKRKEQSALQNEVNYESVAAE